MEKISLTVPHTNEKIELEIYAKQHSSRQPAWNITFKDGRNALIGLNQHRIWEQLDGNDLDSGLITKIGEAIESNQRR
jgi:hypothetical protein